MVSIYPSDFYAPMFHNLVANGNYKSRLFIYSIDLANNPIDVSNRTEVEYYGELLTYKVSDTDSNGRIAQNGIKLNNYYNKDEEYTIGNAPIASIEISFINDDGFFSTYDWDQTIIVYWDLWDEANQMWIGCPIGVYWWERPAKTSTVVVSATGYDVMSRLDLWTGWSWPSFDNGPIPLGDIYKSLANYEDGAFLYAHPEDWPNMTITIDSAPFDVTNMTNREILAKLAEIAGSNVFASRDGRIKMKPFTNAYWKLAPQAQPTYYELDGDSLPTPITKIEIGEYTVPSITQLIAQVGQTGKEFVVGPGSQTMYSINNGFLAVDDTKANQMLTTMLGVVSGTDASSDMVPYAPLYIRAYADPTVEAGDVIRVIRNETTYLMPVFQQTLYWNGADWIIEMQNSGYAKRSVPSEAERESYVNEYRLSQLEPYRGGDGPSDSTPYYLRRSGGGSLGTVNRETDSLIGGTVAWNQIIPNLTASTTTKKGVTFTRSTDGTITTSGTATADIGGSDYAIVSPIANVSGHKYYFSGAPKNGSVSTYFAYDAYSVRDYGNGYIGEIRLSRFVIFIKSGTNVDGLVWKPQLFDLTLMFGSTIADYIYALEHSNAGAGIAWLKRYGFFTEDYYPYHAATLESVKTSAHVMRDADDNIIGNYALDPIELRGILKKDASNNLYYDGDTYEADGTVTRKYAIVDLGTLSWNADSGRAGVFYTASIQSTIKQPSGASANLVCAKYIWRNSGVPSASNLSANDKQISGYPSYSGGRVYIIDTAYASTSAADFKTAMSGVYLVYELATPTTETASPYINPQAVDANGTEQYVDAGTRDFEMPVGHETSYYNLASDAQQIYDTPTTDGTYRLICTVVNGTPSYSWVAET